MIEVEGLRKRYGGRLALDQVDFTVPRGEIFGFLGPNGAGKTTTIRILATLTPPDAGTASIGGVRIDREPFAVRRRRVAAELLELVDLGARAGDQVDTLSRGMKQRLCLARSLVHNPQVLLLDEPASGLDPRARLEMQELIRELRRMGKTILVSSHIVPEVEELCTWIGVIDGGRIVEIGPKADVLRRAAGSRRMRIRLAEPDDAALARARELVGCWPGVLGVEDAERGLEAAVESGLPAHRLLRDLVQAGLDVDAFTPLDADLSDVFMRLTEEVPA